MPVQATGLDYHPLGVTTNMGQDWRMQRTDSDVDDFLASLEGDNAATMWALDAIIAPVFEGCERMLWQGVFWGGSEQQIIGYGGIVQARPKGDDVEWFLVGLAEQKLRALLLRAREVTPGVR
jgi:hypothetical protein